ncbi:hypothetical protein ABPG73_011845 [Tetrahymena malaccensis]
MYKLSNQQTKNEMSKFKIFEMINLHQQHCTHLECICKISNFKDKKDNLNQEDVYILIEQIFYRTLKSNLKNIDFKLVEQIYLKYITYLTRTRNRPTKAYFELKQYISKKQNTSFYFDLIKNVLSSKIEKIMSMNQKVYIKTKIVDNYLETIKEELDTNQIFQTDDIVKQIIPELATFVDHKIQFWRKLLLSESQDILSFYKLATDLSKKSKTVQKIFQKNLQIVTNKVTASSNITLAKIIEIYKCTVTSDYLQAFKFSQLYNALYNRDIQKQQIIINSYNIVKGNVQTLKISLSQDLGKIISQKTEKLANFFGYVLKEFQQINKIDDLMPLFISQIHDKCINNMIQRGFSPMISDKISTFIKNKDSFIEPINLYLQNHQNQDEDFCLQALLLKTINQREYIVFDEQGYIQGITQNMFNLIFQKREKYDKQIKQLFHIEGPHPIPGDKIIELKSFLYQFNLYLLMPQISKIVRKHQHNQQSVINMYNKFKSPQKKVNLIVDASLVDQHFQICLNQNSDLFLPIRIFHLNNLYQKQFVDVLFKKNLNTDNQVSKSPEQIEQFLSQHLKDYDEEHIFCQFSMIFNLQKRIYTYQDQNQQNIQKKIIYVMEIVEKTDLTSKGFKQNAKTEKQKTLFDFDSQKTLSQIVDGQQLPSTITKEKLSYTEQTSIPSFNDQQYFESSQEIDNAHTQSSPQRQLKFKKLESQKLQNRVSDFGLKIDQSNFFQSRHSLKSNQIDQVNYQTNLGQNQAKTKLTKKHKTLVYPTSLINFNAQNNNNNQSMSQKDLSYIFSADETIRNPNENQTNKIKEESNIFYLNDQKNDQKKKQEIDVHPPQEKEQNDNELFLNSIHSNRIHSPRDNGLFNQEDNQLNTYTIISPRQIQSQENLMPFKENSSNQNQSQTHILSYSQQRLNRVKEKLNILKSNSQLNIFKNDAQELDEESQWNKLIDNAQKIATKQDSKKFNNQNKSSSSSSIDYKAQNAPKYKEEKQIIQNQAIGVSQTVTSRGTFFLLVIILLSYLFYQIVQNFLSHVKTSLVNSYSSSMSEQIYANQTNNAYNLYLMSLSTPVYNLQLIQQLAPVESYSCVYNGLVYNGYIGYIFNVIYDYAQQFPLKNLDLEIFSNQQSFEVQAKLQQGFFLQQSNALVTCQASQSEPPQLLFDLDGFFFKISNHIYMNQEAFAITANVMSQLQLESLSQKSKLEIIFYSSIGLSSFCFMIIILIIQRINAYKQKVVLLISRINLSEIEKEVQKFESCLKHIQSPIEDWLKIDFINQISNYHNHHYLTVSSSKNFNQEERERKKDGQRQTERKFNNNVKINTVERKSQSQTLQTKEKNQNNQKQRVLSSSFISRKIFNYRQIIIGGGIFITGILFVGFALFIASKENQNFQQACNIYYTVLDTIRAADSIILVSQILLTSLYLEKSVNFPKQNITKSYSYYQSQIQVLQNFESNFMQLLSDQTQMDQTYKNLIFDVLQNDVCEQQNSQIHMQNNIYFQQQLQVVCNEKSSTKIILQNGVIGVINQYIRYGASLEEFMIANKFTDSFDSQQQMIQILNSIIHIELITKGFLAPINSICTVTNLFNTAFKDRSNIYLTAFKIYFLILLPFLTLITFLVIVVYTKNTQNEIVDINFTLTLIPYDKLLDENTINMLKQLRKYK